MNCIEFASRNQSLSATRDCNQTHTILKKNSAANSNQRKGYTCLLNLQFSLFNRFAQQLLDVIDNLHFLYRNM